MEKSFFIHCIHEYIHLLSLYLNKKESTDLVIDDGRFSFFIKISKHHSLTAFLYQALVNVRAIINNDYLKELEKYYLANLRKCILFDKEREDLFNYLNEEQIDYLPLKGIILKNLYLDPFTREFADNDILFADSSSSLIKNYFVKHGYDVCSYEKSGHDVYTKKPFFNFEMHRALFSPNGKNDRVVMYFKDYLFKAPVKEGYEHYLSDEDFFIYFIAHSYKHYDRSGCGIRTLIDIYIFLKNKQLDFNYVNQELEKLDLLTFSNEIINLSNALFDEQTLNKAQEEFLLYIASSGTYGTLNHSVDKGIEEKGKTGYLLFRLFPPYSSYKTLYPWAYKCPILIPIAWIVRFFRILFNNPEKATKEIRIINNKNKK